MADSRDGDQSGQIGASQNLTGGSRITRYFCHQCSRDIPNVTEDFTCPTCHGGFIEELPANQVNDGFDGGASGGSGAPEGLRQFLNALGLATSNSGGAASHQIFGIGGTPLGSAQETQASGSSSNSNPGSRITVTMTRGNGNNVQVDLNTTADNPIDVVFNSFLNDLIVGLGGGRVGGPGTVPFLGNLGDYVWGRDGLDSIVTQLMNQMEGGPPPLPKEKLENLPSVKIVQEQVNKKLQCSVCWEDFVVDEEVKELPCEHVFHPPCILPWLKLHGTCPICRRDFTEGEQAQVAGGNPVASTTDNAGSQSQNIEENTSGTSMDTSEPTPSSRSFNPMDILNLAFNRTPSQPPVPDNVIPNQSDTTTGGGGESGSGEDHPNINMDMEFD